MKFEPTVIGCDSAPDKDGVRVSGCPETGRVYVLCFGDDGHHDVGLSPSKARELAKALHGAALTAESEHVEG